jgi:hypothetical protein
MSTTPPPPTTPPSEPPETPPPTGSVAIASVINSTITNSTVSIQTGDISVQSEQRAAVEFGIETLHVTLKRGGIAFAEREVRLEEEFVVEVTARVTLSNPGPPTSVAFYVTAIEPDCLKDGVSTADLKVAVEHKVDLRPLSPRENPLRLEPDEMTGSIRLRVMIPFSLAKIESQLGSLYSLKSMSVTFGARQTGRDPILRSESCDLAEIHRQIEGIVEAKIQHMQGSRLSARQMLDVVKRYWRGPG